MTAAGINLEAVRERAIERGMISKDDKVDPSRLLEYIRESGFSTAKTVTGLAGRGVGMDVVNSEIKQIGGSHGYRDRGRQGNALHDSHTVQPGHHAGHRIERR